MGVINIDATDRNGDVVGMTVVCEEDELMLITQNGILIRTKVGDIRQTGRNAQGVRLMRLDEGDRLVAMAKIDADTDSNGGANGSGDSTTDESPAE